MPDIIIKYKFDQSTWTYKGFHGVLHTFGGVVAGIFTMKKFFGDTCKVCLFFNKDDYIHWYWNDNDLDRLRNKFFKRLKQNHNYLKKLQQDWQKKLNRFDKMIAKVHKTNLSQLSNNQLADLYEKYYQLYMDEFGHFMALGDAISMHADHYLVPEFKKVLGKDFNKVFPQLITTKHKSFIDQELQDRQKLIRILKQKQSISPQLLEKHAAKHFFIKNNYAQAVYLTGKDFLEIIRKDLRQKRKLELKSQSQASKNHLIKKYHLTHWHKTLLYVLDEFFGIQDTRKKYVLISNYYQFQFLKELAKRTGIPFSLLKYSIHPEFGNILQGRIKSQKIFEDRKKLSVCIQTPTKYEIVTGPEAKKAFNYFMGVNKNIDQIKGIVASKGKVKGKAKIILKIDDIKKMNKGDIIVSSMTRPEMMPAIKKAAGIVTDEGGVTCHAAIVARELGIPCIIGTKIATKVLRDGDLVQVDADKGIVVKLKK